jgi:phosphate transport system permease protein
MTTLSPVVTPAPDVSLAPRSNRYGERLILAVLWTFAAVSIATTLAIVFVLLEEGAKFFGNVSIVEFLTDTEWRPFGDPLSEGFRIGVLPLVSGTLLVTVIALSVAVPLGLASAAYLSEYAPARVRGVLKPMLEVLAGIPTVVLGYFALTLVTPALRTIFSPERISIFNALSAGLVVGIMIIPTVASLSEDALRAVPDGLRAASYGMGATKSVTIRRVLFPAALSGIVSAVILAMGRAIGETMIVSVAAGNLPTLTVNPGSQIQTMTGYIVQAVGGEASRGSLTYNSIFAIGIVLFLMTFALNIIANRIVRRFREAYE